MSENQNKLQEELARIEQAIVAQEALRGVLTDEQIVTTVTTLRARQATLRARQEASSGAIAQDRSVAAGEGGTAVQGDVHGPIIYGNHNIGGDTRGDVDMNEQPVINQFGSEATPPPPDLAGSPDSAGSPQPAAELELLQEQLQTQKFLLVSYQKQLVLAGGSEAAKLEVQIGQLEQDIRRVQRRLDELQARK